MNVPTDQFAALTESVERVAAEVRRMQSMVEARKLLEDLHYQRGRQDEQAEQQARRATRTARLRSGRHLRPVRSGP